MLVKFARSVLRGEQELRQSMPTILLLLMMMQAGISSQCAGPSEITALRVSREIELNAAHPAQDWKETAAITFCADWQGQHPDPGRETTVRALWTEQTLFLRFECAYRNLYVFPDADANGRRDHLWDRDVTEAFLQPDPAEPRAYREFEISPNGFWIDLAISPKGDTDLKSGLRRSVWLDEKARRWSAELAIPMKSLTANFDPTKVWRANFYRVEGPAEPRAYLAWQPTNSLKPNFHVPEAFGKLRFIARR
jgi:alpha-galactosidase